MQHPQPQDPPLQPAKKKDGCLTALLVCVGLGFALCVVIGIAIHRFMGTPEGQQLATFVGTTAKIATESESAPGTKELRALGCARAAVIDMQRMDVITHIGSNADAAPTPYRFLVTCEVLFKASAPTCEQVSATYLKAVGTPAGVYVAAVAQAGHGDKPVCSSRYGVDGVKTGDWTAD